MDRWRTRYSNLMSTVAVVIALTGGSLAVAAIGRDDVGSKQVKDESLRSRDLADGLAVAGTDVINGSIGADDLAKLPHAAVSASATQTFFDGSRDIVGLDTISAIDQVGFDDGFDSLVIQRPGMYLVTGWIRWSPNGTGPRRLGFATGPPFGVTQPATTTPAVSGMATEQTVTWLDHFNGGDSINLVATQGSGGDLANAVESGRSASMSVQWLGP
jgi:hypothetical protein